MSLLSELGKESRRGWKPEDLDKKTSSEQARDENEQSSKIATKARGGPAANKTTAGKPSSGTGNLAGMSGQQLAQEANGPLDPSEQDQLNTDMGTLTTSTSGGMPA